MINNTWLTFSFPSVHEGVLDTSREGGLDGLCTPLALTDGDWIGVWFDMVGKL